MLNISSLLQSLGVDSAIYSQGNLTVYSPIDGAQIATVHQDSASDVDTKITQAQNAFTAWRVVPAPARGELIRIFGNILREHKTELGQLVTLECGKILSEGLGEVQEMIDICDFAVGLSRQLYGLTIASERPRHKMLETWHPLGPIGVISAFNFPVAVWAWNASLAIVCGDPVVWKPSEKTPLTALACQQLFLKALQRYRKAGYVAPEGLSHVIIGDRDIGEQLVDDARLPLISATGSTAMGRAVGPRVAQRFGRSLLELGGNNAMIVAPSADLDLAVRAILFSAVGTAGQRCTTLRRLIVHSSIYDTLLSSLKKVYGQLSIGDPLSEQHIVGPLIDQGSFDQMQTSLNKAKQAGATVTGGQRVLENHYPNAYYVQPAIVEYLSDRELIRQETFAPILYCITYKQVHEAIAIQNDVPQGLSSCIFTNDLREAELFLSPEGSDCGIANVNIGPSGAEIGGAFGGEKETGGGRESGSDAWKNYMRRTTSTTNYSKDLPLAQGVKFDI